MHGIICEFPPLSSGIQWSSELCWQRRWPTVPCWVHVKSRCCGRRRRFWGSSFGCCLGSDGEWKNTGFTGSTLSSGVFVFEDRRRSGHKCDCELPLLVSVFKVFFLSYKSVVQEVPTRPPLTRVSHKSVKQCLFVCFRVRVCIRVRGFYLVLHFGYVLF